MRLEVLRDVRENMAERGVKPRSLPIQEQGPVLTAEPVDR